jgi:hypothetical protein
MSDEMWMAAIVAEEERQRREREEGPLAKAFREADVRFIKAVQRVMVARTTADPMGFGRDLDWTEFRDELARLNRLAEERHAAKHAAQREAMLAPMPTIYRDPGT